MCVPSHPKAQNQPHLRGQKHPNKNVSCFSRNSPPYQVPFGETYWRQLPLGGHRCLWSVNSGCTIQGWSTVSMHAPDFWLGGWCVQDQIPSIISTGFLVRTSVAYNEVVLTDVTSVICHAVSSGELMENHQWENHYSTSTHEKYTQ
jgi:hypothetical protein